MKSMLLPAALVLVIVLAFESAAQQPNTREENSDGDLSNAGGQEILSPEMWYYKQQLERYDDPKTAVRRNAEFQAQQRMARLEAMKWYGYSQARPTVSPTPFTSTYIPAWQFNSYRPYSWYASSWPAVVVTGR